MEEIRERSGDGYAKRIAIAGFMGLLLLSTGARAAGQRSGAKVLITTAQASEQITGELMGVRNDAIVVEEERGGSREIAIDEIASLRLYRRSAWLPGVLLGALVGGAAGAGLSSSRDSSGDGPFEGVFFTLIYVGAGAAGGGLLGGVLGGTMSADKTYDLTKMSPDEKNRFVSKLRKKARVTNYQ